ncbi:MAG: hypothetical protein IJR83_08270 [Clostridia bacterium]|nr:hypothetical protein [Clostridia bacterium]
MGRGSSNEQNRPSRDISLSSVRLEAKFRLAEGGKRLYAILLGIVATALTVGGQYAVFAPCQAVYNWLFYAGKYRHAQVFGSITPWISVAFALLVILPCLAGVIKGVLDACRERQNRLTALTAPFCSFRSYGRALLFLAGDLIRLALGIVPSAVLVYGMLRFEPVVGFLAAQTDAVRLLLYIACGVAVAGLLFLALLAGGITFMTPYYRWVYPDKSVFAVRRMARESSKGLCGKIFGFHIFFIGLSMLSALSLGILFFLYVFPLWVMSYVVFAEQIAAGSAEVGCGQAEQAEKTEQSFSNTEGENASGDAEVVG